MSTPSDGPHSPYGWARTFRDEYIAEQRKSASTTLRVPFQDGLLDLPVIVVPVDLPKYRLANGRTAALQEEYIALRRPDRPDFFRADEELLEAQEQQHVLLKELVSEAGLFDYFKDPANQQVEPIILDSAGFVVNGNRRLCAWRELLYTARNEGKGNQYAHFGHVRAALLPPADERAIDRLEAYLQLQRDIRADYSWYTRAQMLRHRKEFHGLSTDDLAEFYSLKRAEVNELLQMHELAAEYLRSRDKENRWSELEKISTGRGGNEYAFRELAEGLKKTTAGDDMALLKSAAFLMIDDPTGGRLYQQIPDLKKYLPKVKDELADEFEIEPDKDVLEFDDDDPLGDDPVLPGRSGYAVAEAIVRPENKEKALSLIREVIDVEKETEKGVRTAEYLITKIRKAHANLVDAVNNGLTSESRLSGVLEQLDLINQRVGAIRDYVAGRSPSSSD